MNQYKEESNFNCPAEPPMHYDYSPRLGPGFGTGYLEKTQYNPTPIHPRYAHQPKVYNWMMWIVPFIVLVLIILLVLAVRRG